MVTTFMWKGGKWGHFFLHKVCDAAEIICNVTLEIKMC